MIQILADFVFKQMNLPLTPPKGLGGDAEKVQQPHARVLWRRLFFWFCTHLLGFLSLLHFFGKLPSMLQAVFFPVDWITGIAEVISAVIEGVSGFDFLFFTQPKWHWIAWTVFIVEVCSSLVMVLLKLDVRAKWYFIDERGLGSREGLWTQVEKYILFQNIQSVHLKQGPVQKILGLATLRIRPAGADKADGDRRMKRAIEFQNIDNAGELHHLLVAKMAALAKEKSAYLAETQNPVEEKPAFNLGLTEAAQNLLSEACNLNRAFDSVEVRPRR